MSRKGVGIIVAKNLEDKISNVENINETIMGFVVEGKKDIMIIQVYFPTSDCDEATSLGFYEKIEKQIQNLGGRRDEVTIVMGDFNSSVR